MNKYLQMRRWSVVGRHCAGLLAAGALALPAQAQVSEYTFSQSTGTYAPLIGGTVVANAVYQAIIGVGTLDDATYAIPNGTIPFPFNINGTAYTGFAFSCNGHLIFDTDYANDRVPISATSRFAAAIAPMGADLQGETRDLNNMAQLRYQTLGAAPNRVFVVQWSNFHFYGELGHYLNFQARLHEGSSAVDYAYQCTRSQAITPGAQVGLRGPTNGDFINRAGTWPASTPGTVNTATLPYSNAVAPPLGLTYTFTPGPPLACPTPYALFADRVRGTTARLRYFVNQAAPGSYTVQYGPAGFNPGLPSGGANAYQTVPATGRTVDVTGLSPLTAYEFYVTQDCGAAGASRRSPVAGRFTTTLLNDDPTGAFVLPIGPTCVPVNGTNAGAITTDSYEFGFPLVGPCSGASVLPLDVWYQFTTAATGLSSTAVQLTVAGVGAMSVRVFAGPATGPLSELRCASRPNANSTYIPTLIVSGLSPSSTYYVQVLGYTVNPPGPFTICASEPPACSTPTSVVLTAPTPTSGLLTFVPGSGSVGGYTVTLTPAGGTPTTVPATGSPVSFANLTPATRYRVTLQANCGAAQSPLITRTFATRPANDEFTGAVALPITPVCAPTAGSLDLASSNVAAPGYSGVCSTRPANYCTDVWYSFTTSGSPGPQAVRVTVTGPGAVALTVFAPAVPGGPPVTQVGCSLAAGPSSTLGPAPPLDLPSLAPATVYYLRIDDQGRLNGATSGRNFTVCLTPIPQCLEPTGVSVGAITATTAVLNLTPQPGQATFSVTYGPPGVAPTTLTNVPAASFPLTLTGLLPGQPYTLSVVGYCTGNGFSPTTVRTFNTAIVNDEPTGALVLPLNPACDPLTGIMTTATRSLANGLPTNSACGQNASILRDVWYRFTTAASGAGSRAVRLTMTGINFGMLQVASSANGAAGPFTAVGCAQGDASRPLVLDLTALLPATSYFVQVAAVVTSAVPIPGPPAMTTFTLCLSEPPTCTEPTDLRIAVSDTQAELSFTPVPGASTYDVFYSELGSPLVALAPQPTALTAPPIVLSNLFPGTTYRVLLTAGCGASGTGLTLYREFRTQFGPPPANEQCVDAVPLTCGQTVLGGAAGASGIGAPLAGNTCGGLALNYSAGPVYYRLVGTGDSLVASTCHPTTGSPSAIWVYSGSCGQFVCVGANQFVAGPGRVCPTNTGTEVGFRSVAGRTYYVLVGPPPNSGNLDSFGLTVSCVALPCLPPQRLTVGPLTGTTASVSFQVPARAVASASYTATAVPVGGVGNLATATGPASPLALTGLTPGVAYTVTVAANCPTGVATSAAVAFNTLLGTGTAALAAQVSVFPNPASQLATVGIPAGLLARAATLVLYNALGQAVQQQAVPAATANQRVALDLRGLATGVYSLRLTTEQGAVVKRLVVE